MLKELERNLGNAKREADRQPFETSAQLILWFKRTYLSKMEENVRKNWLCSQNGLSAHILVNRTALCPENCKQFAEDRDVVRNGMLRDYHLRSTITKLLRPGRRKATIYECFGLKNESSTAISYIKTSTCPSSLRTSHSLTFLNTVASSQYCSRITPSIASASYPSNRGHGQFLEWFSDTIHL